MTLMESSDEEDLDDEEEETAKPTRGKKRGRSEEIEEERESVEEVEVEEDEQEEGTVLSWRSPPQSLDADHAVPFILSSILCSLSYLGRYCQGESQGAGK